VDNAVKYGRSASVGLALDAEHIVITVEDEGPGIPRNERERVFEPFYRIESSRDPGTGGVGLGLSVTRSIIWEHGGEIVLANRKGGGLSIRLELPAPSQPALSAEVEACSSERRRETRAGADTA
jgi:K+-sensing histidine kinase KdpD